jgi:hypothetical protein
MMRAIRVPPEWLSLAARGGTRIDAGQNPLSRPPVDGHEIGSSRDVESRSPKRGPAMIVVIDDAGRVRLEHPLDFERLHVEIAAQRSAMAQLRGAAAPSVDIERETQAWVDAAALRQWPSQSGDAEYRAGLGRMLDHAARKGWTSPDGSRVRARVVWH